MKRERRLVVSVHDVAPPYQSQTDRILTILGTIGVHRRSLLVVPNYHRKWPLDRHEAFAEWLRHRQSEGDEIVLHGYEHLGIGTPTTMRDHFKNRWWTRGEGEFLSLTYAQAADRIARGAAMVSEARLDVQGFVAPAWLINPDGLRAARDGGFQYSNSYAKLIDLANGSSHFAPSLVFGPGHLNENVAVVVQRRLSDVLRISPLVRIVLHPPCINDWQRFGAIVGMIESQLAIRRPLTYRQLLEQLRLSS